MFNVNYQTPFQMTEEPKNDKLKSELINRVLNTLKSPPDGGKVAGQEKDAMSTLARYVLAYMQDALYKHPALFIDASTGNINRQAVKQHVDLAIRFWAATVSELVEQATALYSMLEKQK
jgi:hypothetical protein